MEFEIAKGKAIAYIVRSRKTENELRLKLKKLGYNQEVIQDVIYYFKDLGYIGDEEYVDAYMRQCMRLKSYSLFEIKNKLLQKGIKKDIIEKKLGVFQDNFPDYEKEIINKLLNSKLKNMEDLKKKQYLFRRGFKNISIYEE